jgi:hypothetical protein
MSAAGTLVAITLQDCPWHACMSQKPQQAEPCSLLLAGFDMRLGTSRVRYQVVSHQVVSGCRQPCL